ncbi:hypothetical protein BJV82DRAFT_713669 [Fennellomyces sp. T-0311]|nr:hypothetical protein BJV82DRAFT_713669 [Fennellomyces sp. T-0311]
MVYETNAKHLEWTRKKGHNQLRFQYNQDDNVRDQRMNLTLAENVERYRRQDYGGWKRGLYACAASALEAQDILYFMDTLYEIESGSPRCQTSDLDLVVMPIIDWKYANESPSSVVSASNDRVVLVNVNFVVPNVREAKLPADLPNDIVEPNIGGFRLPAAHAWLGENRVRTNIGILRIETGVR